MQVRWEGLKILNKGNRMYWTVDYNGLPNVGQMARSNDSEQIEKNLPDSGLNELHNPCQRTQYIDSG